MNTVKGMKVYILRSAENYSDSIGTIYGHTWATVANPNPEHKMLHTPSSCVLIDHPTVGWILYDTGTADDYEETYPAHIREKMATEKPEEFRMVNQLAMVGIKPEDVKYVIMSHMHMDHIGNNKLFVNTAKFLVSEAEAGHAFRMVFGSENPVDRGWYIREEIILPYKKIFYLNRDEEQLFPGIEIVQLPGHTPGVMGLIVHLENSGTLFFTSDAANVQANYDGIPPAGLYDSLGFMRSIEKIRDLQKKYNAKLIFSHDSEQLKTLKVAPEFYD